MRYSVKCLSCRSPEEVLHGRTKYWHLYFLKFAHICCCSSSHCGVPAFKLIHVLSLQASSDLTSDIGTQEAQRIVMRGPSNILT